MSGTCQHQDREAEHLIDGRCTDCPTPEDCGFVTVMEVGPDGAGLVTVETNAATEPETEVDFMADLRAEVEASTTEATAAATATPAVATTAATTRAATTKAAKAGAPAADTTGA